MWDERSHCRHCQQRNEAVFFFQAEDGIRDKLVTGVQTCALPISAPPSTAPSTRVGPPASGVADFRDVTGGVYKARERIHRSVADLRLLATPTSWGRVADPNPN